MNNQAHVLKNDLTRPFPARVPFYYGWVNLLLAAIAMVATLPGRSVGIGLITEPLLRDLSLSRVSFGEMNFWATLLGASFNLLCGPAIDRFGVRAVVTTVLLALSLVVLAFSKIASAGILLILLILMRGVGQSALSVVSLTIIGKWFVRRLSIAMAVFSIVISIAFATSIVTLQKAVAEHGWRGPWQAVSWWLLAAMVLSWLFVRRNPESVGLEPDRNGGDTCPDQQPQAGRPDAIGTQRGFTLTQALKQPAFWIFALGSALYNMVIAGVLLFNQSILTQLGFGESVFRSAMAVYMVTGLGGNLLAGWLARRWRLTRLMAMAMVMVALYLLTFPFLQTTVQALAHAALLGFSGGVVVVIFFTSWGQVFGRQHLGKIQGAAQVFTVFASASGPWLLSLVFEKTGSYAPAFHGLAPAILLVALAGWFVQVPRRTEAGNI